MKCNKFKGFLYIFNIDSKNSIIIWKMFNKINKKIYKKVFIQKIFELYDLYFKF